MRKLALGAMAITASLAVAGGVVWLLGDSTMFWPSAYGVAIGMVIMD